MFKKNFLDINDSLIEMYTGGPSAINLKLFNMDFVKEYFGYSKEIAIVFLMIALAFAIIGLLFSFEYFSAARLKKVIYDVAVSIFMLGSLGTIISWALEGSVYFSALWSGGYTGVGAMLGGVGLTSAVLAPLNLGFLILILIVLLFVFIFYVISALINLLLIITLILFPIVVALYPLSFFKRIFTNFMMLFVSLLLVLPLQNLCILAASKVIFDNALSITSIAALFALIILVTFIIPGIAIASFNKLFSLTN